MVIKKSELYSSLWASCEELRGGMDASQYKDYVLVLLFVKYVSDKYAGNPYAPVKIPDGASFKDMVALKGSTDIGDQINKKIIGPLAIANDLSDMPDFNDATKLGTGKEMVDRLSALIAIFENPALTSPATALRTTTYWGMRTSILCATSPQKVARAKGNFIPLLKSAESWPRLLASTRPLMWPVERKVPARKFQHSEVTTINL